MVVVSKDDFVNVEFTGKIVDTGEVFDTNVKSVAQEHKFKVEGIKPFSLAVGFGMLPSGFDNDLVGKEVGKSYSLDLPPQDAFGLRNPQMVRMVPTKMFHAQKINPVRGMQLALDGQLVKVLSNSGGRTLVDFNNPLAGRRVHYDYTVLGKITDLKEKVDALQEFLFKKTFDVDIDEEKKVLVFSVDSRMQPYIAVFSSKFEEILGYKAEAKVVEKKGSKEGSSDHSHTHDDPVHNP